ncbi:MAG: two-component system sensor histidine kinase NtrB [Myxococcota bacterium]
MTRRDSLLLAFAVAMMVAIAITDVLLPRGAAVGVLYALPIAVSMFLTSNRYIWTVAAAGSVLVLGLFVVKEPSTTPSWIAATNRGLSLLVIWSTGLVASLEHDTRRRLHLQRDAREHALAELEKSRHQLEDMRFALDQAAIVAITDRSGRILYANDKFCEISGYTRGELVGKDHRIVNSGHHPKAFFVEMWRTIAGGNVWRGEILNRAKDGHRYWVDTTIVPFVGADGRPYQYLSIRTDITERKRAEEQLRRQEALARLGEMSAVVAHEVKNPLTGIAGALQVISGRLPEGGTERRVVGDILGRIRSLQESLQDLLEFARPRAPRRAPIHLLSLLRETADFVTADGRFADLAVDVAGSDVVVDADDGQLREAFLNLVLNAAQAMDGKGRIDVSVTAGADACRVCVRDEGPGIPADVLPRVFEPFFTTRARGTGLGLPIVRRTVEAHGGSIAIECPGTGTSVTVELPLNAPQCDAVSA